MCLLIVTGWLCITYFHAVQFAFQQTFIAKQIDLYNQWSIYLISINSTNDFSSLPELPILSFTRAEHIVCMIHVLCKQLASRAIFFTSFLDLHGCTWNHCQNLFLITVHSMNECMQMIITTVVATNVLHLWRGFFYFKTTSLIAKTV